MFNLHRCEIISTINNGLNALILDLGNEAYLIEYYFTSEKKELALVKSIYHTFSIGHIKSKYGFNSIAEVPGIMKTVGYIVPIDILKNEIAILAVRLRNIEEQNSNAIECTKKSNYSLMAASARIKFVHTKFCGNVYPEVAPPEASEYINNRELNDFVNDLIELSFSEDCRSLQTQFQDRQLELPVKKKCVEIAMNMMDQKKHRNVIHIEESEQENGQIAKMVRLLEAIFNYVQVSQAANGGYQVKFLLKEFSEKFSTCAVTRHEEEHIAIIDSAFNNNPPVPRLSNPVERLQDLQIVSCDNSCAGILNPSFNPS